MQRGFRSTLVNVIGRLTAFAATFTRHGFIGATHCLDIQAITH
jgi:hypothetical protein